MSEIDKLKQEYAEKLYRRLFTTNIILDRIYSVLNFFRIIFIVAVTVIPIAYLIVALLRE